MKKQKVFSNTQMTDQMVVSESVFRFHSVYYSMSAKPDFCDIRIRISKPVNEKNYIVIQFFENFESVPPTNEQIQCSPFRKRSDFDEVGNDGEIEMLIVYDNEMTSTLIDFLMLSDEELKKNIGNDVPHCYRENIIHSLRNFWD
jgi:hypothetical protein